MFVSGKVRMKDFIFHDINEYAYIESNQSKLNWEQFKFP